MPDLKITQLTETTVATVNDPLPIVNGGTTRKITSGNLGKQILDATAKTANYTLTTSDRFITVDATSGNKSVFVPAASGNTGIVWIVKKIDSSSNTVTIDPDASETIDGASTYVLTAQNQAVSFTSNGTNIVILQNNSSGGGGSGDVVGPASSTDNALVRFDSTTGKLIQNSVATLTDTGTLDTANLTTDYIQIDTAATPPTVVEGTLAWNTTEGSLELGLRNGNVSNVLGEDLHVRVSNAEATTLNKGEVVYLFGATGNRASVKRASNTSDLTSAKTLGIVAESIGANQTGFVITQGVIDGLSLGAPYADGDILWLGSTAGTFTRTKPVQPNHLVFIGVIERANAGNGQIYVKPQNGYELDELHDVLITSPANGQLLIRDETAGLWKNAFLTAGSNITITNAAGVITIAASGGGGGISDGDKGDITVSGSGTTWTIDNSAVTLAKQADVSTGTVFYRKTAGTGAPEVQTLSTLKTDLGLTGTNSGDQTITLTGNVTGSGTGSFATTIANDAVTTSKILNANVTYAKIQDVTNNRLLGRANAVNGTIQEISLGSNLSFSGTTLNATTFQKVITSGTAAPSGGIDGDIYLQYT